MLAQVVMEMYIIFLPMLWILTQPLSGRHIRKVLYLQIPAFTQIHPTCIPVHGDYQSKLTLMSESLRNDGRIWVPKKKEDAEKCKKEQN